MAVTEKSRAIEQAIQQIEKQFGKGSIMKLGGAGEKIDAISTGSLAVDLALGVGGFPRGRVIEIYGPEASGKTTLALHAVASAQKAGGTAAFIDAEHALDAAWARTCGVSTDDLLISQPDNGQQALEIADTLVRSAPSTSSSSTRSRRSCRVKRSRARWATRSWDCRRGS